MREMLLGRHRLGGGRALPRGRACPARGRGGHRRGGGAGTAGGARGPGPGEAASVPQPRICSFIREKLAYQGKTGTL
jgi:hypothetical protein